jgi:hypothetical protein
MNGQGDDCWVRVRILGPQDPDGRYRVEVEMDDGRWFQHTMKLGDAEESALVAITPGDTQAYGIKLYQLLFSNSDNPDEPSLREALQNAWGRAAASQNGQLRVQLWISEECSELHRFRWERLFMPLDNQWRALANFHQTPFSRFTRLPLRDPETGTQDRPLKVLVAISNPQDLAELPGELAEVEVEKEIKNFYEAIKDFPEVFVTFAPGRTGIKDESLLAALAPPRFRVINNESTTIKLIQRELVHHHILHFTGHGTFEKGKRKELPDIGVSTPTMREGVAAQSAAPANARASGTVSTPSPLPSNKRATWLVMEGGDGNAEKVEDASIVHNLIQRGDNQLPRLIFLSSCDTSRYDERNPRAFNSLGPRLVEAGFPAVVAMQDKVPMDVAGELTRNFYGNLLAEGVIDAALNRSRWFLYDGMQLLDNWTIPVLYMRTPRGQLFTADPKRLALRAISESKQFGPLWDYPYLPLEAVVLVHNQISANWENTVIMTRTRVDLQEQLQRLLNQSDQYNGPTAPDGTNVREALVIALTGERGTARSTTARAIVRATAEQSLALSGDSSQRSILPIYVDLGEVIVALGRVPSYLNLLVEGLKRFWPDPLDEAIMDELLEAEQCRIIFDNGDDLSPSQRNQLLEEIGKLTHDFPRHQYLLTMGRSMWRFEQDRVATSTVSITHLLDVQPISRYRIEKFLDECVEFDRQAALKKASPGRTKPAATNATSATAVTTVQLDTPDTSVTAVTTVTLDTAHASDTTAAATRAAAAKCHKNAVMGLRLQLEQTQLFDMAAMPWMLVRMIRQAQVGNLPKSRVAVLRDLLEDKVSWITQWRGQQARALETLYELAYQMQRQNLAYLPIRDALTIIARVRDNREYALEEMLDSLIAQDLLARTGGDAVRFLYPQYQAYCCAQYLCRQRNPKLWEEITAGLGRITHLRRWNDTLTLLCGLLEQPQILLETIAYATSLKDGEQVYLAARCLLEARQGGTCAALQAKKGADEVSLPGSYVESLVLDALLWRSDSTNEPRPYQRLRAVEALGRQPYPEVARFLRYIAMEKTRKNAQGEPDFEFGSIRQAAGRALRRLLSSGEEPARMMFRDELLHTDPSLEELICRWIAADIVWLTAKVTQTLDTISDKAELKVAQAMAGMAAFALGDLHCKDAYNELIKAFLADSTAEVVRWAITDALAVLDPEAIMPDAVHPLLDSCTLREPTTTNGERREQLIYLIGQLRYPDERALDFVEGVLRTPDVPYDQKGRAILAIGFLYPPTWEDWKRKFEWVATAHFDAVYIQPKDQHEALYLQTKAIQALAEIGDLQTLKTLRRCRQPWPIELERAFYSTSEEIVWRHRGG